MKKMLLVLLVAIPLISVAQNNITWDFPIKPGTEAWAKLSSSQEMIDACHIPNDILITLTTNELAEICISYPLLADMLLTRNFQDGFERTSKIFNGFQELLLRDNAGPSLLRIYEQFDLVSFQKTKGNEVKNVFLDMCLDVVMAQPVFLKQLNQEQEKRLMKISLEKLKTHQQIGSSLYRQKSTTVILSRILTKNAITLKEFDKAWKDKFFLLNNYFILDDESIIENIEQLAESYLKNQ